MSEDAQASETQAIETAMGEPAYTETPDVYAPEPAPSFVGKMMSKKIYLFAVIGVIVIVVIAAVTLGMGGGGSLFAPKKTAPPALSLVAMTGSSDIKGPQVPVGKTDEQAINFGGGGSNNTNNTNSSVTNVYEVTAACSWTDDYAGSEPDEMLFELVSPSGQNVSKDTSGTSGSATLTIQVSNMTSKKVDDNTAGWKLKVTCVKAGHKDAGPFGFLIHPDAGNNYDAKISYKYYGKEGKK